MSAEPPSPPPASGTAGPASSREPLEALAEELIERRRRGEHPAISEYIARRPDLAAGIAALFPTLIELEELGQARVTGSTERAGPAPAVLGDFQILREVARGGMGVVYEAEQISLGRR